MKKILLFITTLFICISAVANDHFWLKFADGTSDYYEAEYSVTDFNIEHARHPKYWSVFDMSVFDDSRHKSNADYHRIKNEIDTKHPGVIYRYETTTLGKEIWFYGDKVIDIYKIHWS